MNIFLPMLCISNISTKVGLNFKGNYTCKMQKTQHLYFHSHTSGILVEYIPQIYFHPQRIWYCFHYLASDVTCSKAPDIYSNVFFFFFLSTYKSPLTENFDPCSMEHWILGSISKLRNWTVKPFSITHVQCHLSDRFSAWKISATCLPACCQF